MFVVCVYLTIKLRFYIDYNKHGDSWDDLITFQVSLLGVILQDKV